MLLHAQLEFKEALRPALLKLSDVVQPWVAPHRLTCPPADDDLGLEIPICHHVTGFYLFTKADFTAGTLHRVAAVMRHLADVASLRAMGVHAHSWQKRTAVPSSMFMLVRISCSA